MASIWDIITGEGSKYVKEAITGLLGESGIADRAKYASGLLDADSPISRDAQAWHQRTQLGLQDQLAGKDTPAAKEAYANLMNMAGNAPLGMTVWHGSPHKFSKFDMSKIGTGEGAQAYGHGLYMAELPEVASGYKQSNSLGKGKFEIDGTDALTAAKKDSSIEKAVRYLQDYGDAKLAKQYAKEYGDVSAAAKIEDLEKTGRLVANPSPPEGSMYKVDIPDEAVARFLDWDKPLSQQAPEVRQAITKLARDNEEVMQALQNGGMGDMKGNILYANLQDIFTRNNKRQAVIGGADAAKWTHDDISRMANGNDAFATKQLQQFGIPGIRYLDGGSRGAGAGSSNFVLFDDQLPRILETNGVPTGLQPWQTGEWQGLLAK